MTRKENVVLMTNVVSHYVVHMRAHVSVVVDEEFELSTDENRRLVGIQTLIFIIVARYIMSPGWCGELSVDLDTPATAQLLTKWWLEV